MNKLFLFFTLLIMSTAMHSQQMYDTFVLDESYYVEPWRGSRQITSPDQSVAWYVNMTAGEYRLKINGKLKEDALECILIIAISPVEGNQFKSISKEITIKNGEAQDFLIDNINIPSEAFYKIEIKGKSKEKRITGSANLNIVLETPTGKGGKARFAKWKTSPSVHLRFMPEDEKKYEYDWLYGEIQVPVGYDPMYTFWMCIGFYRGYFGIQVNSDTERRVLFSVWDSSNEAIDRNRVKLEDRVLLLNKNPEVYAGSFANEGTGGQSFWRYNWITGIPVKFLMNMRKLEGDFVVYSAWFMDKEQDGWKYMATWQAPREKRYFDGFYAFVENFGQGNGQMVREGDFYNMWGRLVDSGKWVEFNKARLTHTDGEPDSRSDYAGGVSKNNPTRYYMSSGGYTNPVDDKKIITVKKTDRQPNVDIVTLTAEVDKAMETKAYLKDKVVVEK